MNITKLINGNLKLQASDELEQRAIGRMRNIQLATTEARFVKRFLRQYGYKTIKPEECGALTDATLITDGDQVWGDMNYQVFSFMELLIRGEAVIWQRG